MSSVPEDRRYTRSHEWVQTEDDIATVGSTDYAQEELGDVVFVGGVVDRSVTNTREGEER